MAAPSVRAVGTASGGLTTTPQSIATPGGTVVSGELLLAIFEYGTSAGTNHITATGWTEVAWRDQVAVTGRTDLAVMGRISNGTEGASVSFALAGTINHWSGRMIAISDHGLGVIGDIVGGGTITGGAAGGASPQTNTLTAITVAADALVLIIGGTAEDANSTAKFSAYTNANLSSITEQMDNVVNTGNGGGFGMATGVATAGGNIGTSTYQQAILEAWNGVQLGVRPDITVAVGQSSETDTANATTENPRRRLITGSAETDTSQAVARLKTATLGTAAETDTATAVTAFKVNGIAQATETDTATVLGPLKFRSTGQASETDTAQAISASEVHGFGQSVETDTALTVTPVTAGQVIGIGQSTETDSARQVTPLRVLGLSEALESDVAAVTAPLRAVLVERASETDLAFTTSLPGIIAVDQAIETDTAQSITAPTLVDVAQAAETDTANDVTPVGEMGTGIVLGPTRVRVGISHNEVT